LPKLNGLLFAKLRFVRVSQRTFGLEMGVDQCEPVCGRHGDFDFGKSTAHPMPASIEQELTIGVWSTGGDREATENAEEQIGVGSPHGFRVGQGNSLRLKCRLEVFQVGNGAEFLEREDVRVEEEEGFDDLSPGLRGLDWAIAGEGQVIIF
jgi:hypothetical protein